MNSLARLRNPLIVSAMAGVLLSTSSVSWGSWSMDGDRVCPVESQKFRKAVSTDAANGCFVFWEDERSGVINIYGVRWNEFGERHLAWPAEGRLCAPSDRMQGAPVSIPDEMGGVIVTWLQLTGAGFDIRTQRFSSVGALASGWNPEGVVACAGSCDGFPAVSSDSAGGAFIVWRDNRIADGNHDIYAQYITGAGVVDAGWAASGLGIALGPRDDIEPAIVSDTEGGAFIAWIARGGGSVYLRRIGENGESFPGWPESLEVCAVAGEKRDVVLAADGAGGVVLVWQDARSDLGDIYAQRVSAVGTVVAGWSSEGTPICALGGEQLYPSLVVTPSQSIVVCWQDARDGTGFRAYSQRLSMDASVVEGWPIGGAPISGTPSHAWPVALVADGGDGAIVAWSDLRADAGDIYAQRLGPSREPAGNWPQAGVALCTAVGRQYDLSATQDGKGGAFVGWTDGRNPALRELYLARVTSDGATGPEILDDRPSGSGMSIYPNPSHGAALIRFRLDLRAPVSVQIFDVSGRVVATLADGVVLDPGEHLLSWDGSARFDRPIAPGIYVVRIATSRTSAVAKMVLLR